jgi:hypothetical protein
MARKQEVYHWSRRRTTMDARRSVGQLCVAQATGSRKALMASHHARQLDSHVADIIALATLQRAHVTIDASSLPRLPEVDER